MTTLQKQMVDIFAGDSHKLAFSVGDATGAAINLTGATLKWKMSRAGVTPAILIKTIGLGITVPSPLTGQFTVDLLQADTLLLNGSYYFQALVVDTAGNQSVIAHGDININRNIKEI